MKLFESTKIGKITLQNHVVMAPMTRSRALGNTPNDLMALYYAQRASAGLLITEGTSPSPNGLGYARIPGLYNEEQRLGWKKVTDAVHAKGGKIFLQIMHTGRVSHPANMPKGARILAPSAIGISGKMWTDSDGQQPYPVPTEMSWTDIQDAIQEYARSAELAIQAGFDGVELHAANGYLLEQFLNPTSNQRMDAYGGSPEGRERFLLEVAKAVTARIGGERTGVRVSPYGIFNDMAPFPGVDEFYSDLSEKLSQIGLVYIHVVDHSGMGAPKVDQKVKDLIRKKFKGAYILSGSYDADHAEKDLQEGHGDLVAFGRPFISNPDLVEKLKNKTPLKMADPATFYTAGAEGYTDY